MSPLQILAAYYGGIQSYPNQIGTSYGGPPQQAPGNIDYRNTTPGIYQTQQLPQSKPLFSIDEQEWLQKVQQVFPDSVFSRSEPATIENVTAPKMIRDAYNKLMGFEVQ